MTESPDERRRRMARERSRRFRERNPNYDRDKSRERRARLPRYQWPAKEQNAAMVADLKANPCMDCGGTFPTVCMDFDHIAERGVKIENVGTMVAHGHSREAILAEIEKCDLVCANCHRIRTNERSKQ